MSKYAVLIAAACAPMAAAAGKPLCTPSRNIASTGNSGLLTTPKRCFTNNGFPGTMVLEVDSEAGTLDFEVGMPFVTPSDCLKVAFSADDSGVITASNQVDWAECGVVLRTSLDGSGNIQLCNEGKAIGLFYFGTVDSDSSRQGWVTLKEETCPTPPVPIPKEPESLDHGGLARACEKKSEDKNSCVEDRICLDSDTSNGTCCLWYGSSCHACPSDAECKSFNEECCETCGFLKAREWKDEGYYACIDNIASFIIIGGVAILVLLCCCFFIFLIAKKKKKTQQEDPDAQCSNEQKTEPLLAEAEAEA